MSLTSELFLILYLISDERNGDEGRRPEYLAQEKFSYVTNYLEQTRDTDVYSVSTDDDSGKPGSSSAPSEFGFEETSGMTVNSLVNKNYKHAQVTPPLPSPSWPFVKLHVSTAGVCLEGCA